MCATGFFLGGSTCSPCHANCLVCYGPYSYTCTHCNVGFYPTNGCWPCPASCLSCQAVNFCHRYAPAYVLNNNMCLNSCDPSCKTCLSTSGSTCYSCGAGYYLNGTTARSVSRTASCVWRESPAIGASRSSTFRGEPVWPATPAASGAAGPVTQPA
jgi:hypothetical protein